MAGQPRLFKSAADLQERVDNYFAYAEENKKPYSIAKLALYMGCDRQTIYNYEKDQEYFDIIKKAREKCIANLEERLLEFGNAGQIFIAKNYGYTDRQEITSNNKNENINHNVEATEEEVTLLKQKYGIE